MDPTTIKSVMVRTGTLHVVLVKATYKVPA